MTNLARPNVRARLREGRTDWYRIDNSATARTADVYIYEEIGYWGVSAADFAREVAGLNVDTINLHLNSPGGDVFDGVAIYNALKTHRATVNVTVDGLAASAASFIAMAGESVTMAFGSQLMIHDAMGICVGNASEMLEMVDMLDAASNNIAAFYASRAGGTVESWREKMRAETWYSATEAVSAKLADVAMDGPAAAVAEPDADVVVVPGESDPDMTAKWDLSFFQHAGRENAPAPDLDPVPEVEHVDTWGDMAARLVASATPAPLTVGDALANLRKGLV